MIGIVLALLANALAVVLVARFAPDPEWIRYETWTDVGIFAVIVGLLNAVVRPFVNILTAPIGCVTLGLFSIVVNGLMFWLAARLTDRVEANFIGATVTALVAGLASGVLGYLVRDDR